MKNLEKIKGRSLLFLVSAILLLCVGFIFIGCGSEGKLKIADPFSGAFALDMSVSECADNNGCSVAFTSESFALDKYNIAGKELTLEAWIKPKTTAATIVFSRELAGGVKLLTGTTTTPNAVIPQFKMVRLLSDGTTTVDYLAESTESIAVDTWSHIAGMMVKADHSAVHPSVTCGGAESSSTGPHMDILINGVVKGCVKSYGGAGDTTAEADAYASNPQAGFNEMAIPYTGVIDEFRFWTTARNVATCMNTELGNNSGDCGRINDNLISNLRFNEGEGHSVTDLAGIGSGTPEYSDPNNAGLFLELSTGWTAGKDNLIAAD